MPEIRWGRCVLAGLGAFATSVVLVTAVVFGYALRLGFQVGGAPNQAKIQAFAQGIAPVLGPMLSALLTVAAGVWASRGMKSPVLQGVVVGVTAALAGLSLAWPPGLRTAVVFAAVLAAGTVGGLLGSRKPPTSSQVGQWPRTFRGKGLWRVRSEAAQQVDGEARCPLVKRLGVMLPRPAELTAWLPAYAAL